MRESKQRFSNEIRFSLRFSTVNDIYIYIECYIVFRCISLSSGFIWPYYVKSLILLVGKDKLLYLVSPVSILSQ